MITITGVDPDMIANNIEPLYPTHPGEVLKDEIEYRKLSQRKSYHFFKCKPATISLLQSVIIYLLRN